MEEIAYYDGKSGSPDEISVPFNDRSHFFGDGVYDATISGNHVIYCLEDHLDRFYSSAAALQINVPMKKQDLAKLLQDPRQSSRCKDTLCLLASLQRCGSERSCFRYRDAGQNSYFHPSFSGCCPRNAGTGGYDYRRGYPV